MTASDSVSPHIGWRALAVVTDLVQPSFRRTTGPTLPRTVRGSTKRQVDMATLSLMYWDIAQHPGDVTENSIAPFDDVIKMKMLQALDTELRI